MDNGGGTMSSITRRYLGDGVYADCDGYRIILSAENNDRENTIYLDDYVIDALFAYARMVWGKSEENTLEDMS